MAISAFKKIILYLFFLYLTTNAQIELQKINLFTINKKHQRRATTMRLYVTDQHFIIYNIYYLKAFIFDKKSHKRIRTIKLMNNPLKRYYKNIFFNNKFWAIENNKIKNKKSTFACFTSNYKLIFEKQLDFAPLDILQYKSQIYIVGKYKNKFLHLFDTNGSYKMSYITYNENFPDYPIYLSSDVYKDSIFIADINKFQIWIIKKLKLKKKICYRNDNELIKIEIIGEKERIYRQKGIHDIAYHNGKIYASCFNVSLRKKTNKFWYDIINLESGTLADSVKTPFLYTFSNNKKYIYHVIDFEMFSVNFK